VWTGAQLAQSTEWIVRLDDADIAELETALRQVEASGVELQDIDRRSFALPNLGV
jgi:hypothetical protein